MVDGHDQGIVTGRPHHYSRSDPRVSLELTSGCKRKLRIHGHFSLVEGLQLSNALLDTNILVMTSP
jgi:hypothetical protein